MSRKTIILSLSVAGAIACAAQSASAQFLAGNVWPNPDLSVAAPPGVDQVYSFYNTPYYTPNVTGDTNPRPNGWHRGGGDFGVTTTPSFTFYNTLGNTAGEGSAPPGLDGYALEVSDSSVNGYGEWFSDWNALPAAVVANPATTGFDLRFFYEDTAPQPRDGQLRVTANFGDAVSNDILTGDPNNLGHVDTTFNNPSAGVGTWTEVDVGLLAPAGAQSLRLTVDSGGGADTTGIIWVSDISVAVPEPASIGIITAGSTMLLARRRRRA
jgi:hypothetical protein